MYASYNINLQLKYVGSHARGLERENWLFWRWGLKEVEQFIIFTFMLLTLFLLRFIHVLGYREVVHVLRFMHRTNISQRIVCRRNKCLIINYNYNWSSLVHFTETALKRSHKSLILPQLSVTHI
jgi:hypothetical protein